MTRARARPRPPGPFEKRPRSQVHGHDSSIRTDALRLIVAAGKAAASGLCPDATPVGGARAAAKVSAGERRAAINDSPARRKPEGLGDRQPDRFAACCVYLQRLHWHSAPASRRGCRGGGAPTARRRRRVVDLGGMLRTRKPGRARGSESGRNSGPADLEKAGLGRRSALSAGRRPGSGPPYPRAQ